MIKAVWRERWEKVRTLREELESHEVDVPVVIERAERREGSVKDLKAAFASFRMTTHGKVRTKNMLKAGGAKASAQERKLRAATKRVINAVMERPARGTIETVSKGRGDDMEVITDPTAAAAECCEFGKRRMGSMQRKWFRRCDVAAEHAVWSSDGTTARSGRVTAIDDDGRYTEVDEAGDRHEQLKRRLLEKLGVWASASEMSKWESDSVSYPSSSASESSASSQVATEVRQLSGSLCEPPSAAAGSTWATVSSPTLPPQWRPADGDRPRRSPPPPFRSRDAERSRPPSRSRERERSRPRSPSSSLAPWATECPTTRSAADLRASEPRSNKSSELCLQNLQPGTGQPPRATTPKEKQRPFGSCSLWKTAKRPRSRASAARMRCASLNKIDLLAISTPGVDGRCRNGPVVARPRLALGSKATSEAEGTGG